MKNDKAELLSVVSSLREERASSPQGPRAVGGMKKSRSFDRWLLAKALEEMGRPNVRFVLWDGQQVCVSAERPVATVFIRDRGALLRLITNPELQFGELYTIGRLEVEGDLVAFLEAIYRAKCGLGRTSTKEKLLRRINRPRRNTLEHARHNIYQHYDIGNEFFKLWLDPEMLYTCAYFPTENAGLDEAQIAKMEHVCRKLRLQPGETVVEAGCGWGGLALYMAGRYGVNVKAYNISKEQVAYARERAWRAGLAEQVEYVEGDYREIRGTFDVFVSVGMLEHVGLEHYSDLGQVITRSLKQAGRGLIHSIGRDRPRPMNAWIEKRIFSGGYPPSLREMMAIFEPWGFSVLDVENLRLHYAKTLEYWLLRYESVADQVAEMFDTSFVRAWRLYLAGSIAVFKTGQLQLFQVSFTRSGDNGIPWTREYLYRD